MILFCRFSKCFVKRIMALAEKEKKVVFTDINPTKKDFKGVDDSIFHPVPQTDGCYEPHTSRDKNREKTPRIRGRGIPGLGD